MDVVCPAVKARELLRSLLNAEQRADYDNSSSFTVHGSLGNRYRIHPGVVANVTLMHHHGIAHLCAHPRGDLPYADVAIGQMLALETDERGFLRIAQVHWLSGGSMAKVISDLRGRRPSFWAWLSRGEWLSQEE